MGWKNGGEKCGQYLQRGGEDVDVCHLVVDRYVMHQDGGNLGIDCLVQFDGIAWVIPGNRVQESTHHFDQAFYYLLVLSLWCALLEVGDCCPECHHQNLLVRFLFGGKLLTVYPQSIQHLDHDELLNFHPARFSIH